MLKREQNSEELGANHFDRLNAKAPQRGAQLRGGVTAHLESGLEPALQDLFA